jgi:hypothetical protein
LQGGGSADGIDEAGERRIQMALNDWGVLLVELPLLVGRKCVYRFDTHSIIVDGPTSFHCQATVHWSAVRHGQMLNDN